MKADGLDTNKSACTVYGRLFILRGESGGGHAPFSCAPFSSQAPPAPPYACSGARLRTSRLTHAYCLRQSRFTHEVGSHLLSAAGKFISLNERHHVPCIIFLKPKCAVSSVQLKTFLCSALALQKNVIAFPSLNFLPFTVEKIIIRYKLRLFLSASGHELNFNKKSAYEN
jgi:hypothetical protein